MSNIIESGRDGIIQDPRSQDPRNLDHENLDSRNFDPRSLDPGNLDQKFRSRKFISEKFRSEKFKSEKFRSRKFRSKKFRCQKFRSRKFRSQKLRSRKFRSKRSKFLGCYRRLARTVRPSSLALNKADIMRQNYHRVTNTNWKFFTCLSCKKACFPTLTSLANHFVVGTMAGVSD